MPPPPRNPRARMEAAKQAAKGLFKNGDMYATRTRSGNVHMSGMTFHDDGTNVWVEVALSGDTEGGDPHFRIFNPPTLVEDPNGDVELRGQRWRVDPIQAIAEAIARSGGAETQKGRR